MSSLGESSVFQCSTYAVTSLYHYYSFGAKHSLIIVIVSHLVLPKISSKLITLHTELCCVSTDKNRKESAHYSYCKISGMVSCIFKPFKSHGVDL